MQDIPAAVDRGYYVVQGNLTCSCHGLTLEVGDTAELPPAYWMGRDTWRAKVIALGRGNYDGECRAVIRRIPPD
jgi:hypothetical protein